MKFTRKASANWKGSGLEGTGTISTASGILDNANHTQKSRFKDAPGTNPEELIGAAHAGCYCMKLSFVIGEAGFTPDDISTNATVYFEDGVISRVHLDVTAQVPGMSADAFATAAQDAKENCPISKSLTADVTLDANLA